MQSKRNDLLTSLCQQKVENANVRVYACNQRAGEFVITFPKAYHAGFNHGVSDDFAYPRSCLLMFLSSAQLQ